MSKLGSEPLGAGNAHKWRDKRTKKKGPVYNRTLPVKPGELEKRTTVLKQLTDINERVANVLKTLEDDSDHGYLMDQFSIYKEKLRRLIIRHEEAAKEREKVLMNVNIVFQKVMTSVMNDVSDEETHSWLATTTQMEMLRDVDEHEFSCVIQSSSAAARMLQHRSDEMISYVREILKCYNEMKKKCLQPTSDDLQHRQHDRLINEISNQALENIRLSNALSSREESLLQLKAVFKKMTAKGNLPVSAQKIFADLTAICSNIEDVHSKTASCLTSGVATYEKHPPTLNEQKTKQQQQQQQQQQQKQQRQKQQQQQQQIHIKTAPTALKEHKTVASALTSIVEACENAERIAKQRNSDEEKAVSLLRKLRDEYEMFKSESVGLMDRYPGLGGDKESLLGDIETTMAVGEDITDPSAMIDTMKTAVTATSSKVEGFYQKIVSVTKGQIDEISANRHIYPEIARARKEKYLKNLEITNKMTKRYKEFVNAFRQRIDDVDEKVTKDLVRRKRHYASKLEELDRRIALQATPVLKDEGQAPDKHGETEQRTKLVEKAREIVQRVRLDTGSTGGDQETDIGHDLRGLKTALGDLMSDDNLDAPLSTGVASDHRRSDHSKKEDCGSLESEVEGDDITLPRIESGDKQSLALRKAMTQLQNLTETKYYHGDGDKTLQSENRFEVERILKKKKESGRPLPYAATKQIGDPSGGKLPHVKVKRRPNFSSFHGYYHHISRKKTKNSRKNDINPL